MIVLAEEINLTQLLRTNVDNRTSYYADEKTSLMGMAPGNTVVVDVSYDTMQDQVLVKLLTEATEKYNRDHQYKDISPTTKAFSGNPSESYEVWLGFSDFSDYVENTSPKGLGEALTKAPVKIWCNSPSFHWQGYNYNLSQIDGALFPTSIRPERWDKIHGKTLLDKHLVQIVSSLGHFFPEIVERLQPQMEKKRRAMNKKVIREADIDEKVVWSFMRANPPTKAHIELINKMIATGDRLNADVVLFLSQTQDSRKNPLTWEQKIDYISSVFPQLNICGDPAVKTFIDAAVWLYNRQYDESYVLVGGDRLQEFDRILNKYNGQDGKHGYYEFENIEVISLGDRDPDADDISGFSATKARNAALDNDFEEFFRIAGTTDKSTAQQMMRDVQEGLGGTITESASLTEALDPEEIQRVIRLLKKYDLEPQGDITPNKKKIEVRVPPGEKRGDLAKDISDQEGLPLEFLNVRPILSIEGLELHLKPNKSGATSTAEQELGAAFAFYSVIEKGKEPTIEEIYTYYPGCPEPWYKSFINSAHALKEWLGGQKGYVYSREDISFPETSSEHIHQVIRSISKILGFANADQWNPSDIYMCKASALGEVLRHLETEIETSATREEKILKVNSYLAEKLQDKTLIGVSLKKASKSAHIEEPIDPDEIILPEITMTDFIMRFSAEGLKKVGLELRMKTDDGATIIGDTRKYPEGSLTPISSDWTQKGAGDARLGKVPYPVRDLWFEKMGMSRPKGSEAKQWMTLEPAVIAEFVKKAEFIVSTLPGTTFTPVEVQEYLMSVAGNSDKNVVTRTNTQLQCLVYGELFSKAAHQGILDELLQDWYAGAKKISRTNAPFIKVA